MLRAISSSLISLLLVATMLWGGCVSARNSSCFQRWRRVVAIKPASANAHRRALPLRNVSGCHSNSKVIRFTSSGPFRF